MRQNATTSGLGESCSVELDNGYGYCKGDWDVDRKKLAETGSGTTHEKCAAMAYTDPDCSMTFYTNNDYCRCVVLGKACQQKFTSSGAKIYSIYECTKARLFAHSSQHLFAQQRIARIFLSITILCLLNIA